MTTKATTYSISHGWLDVLAIGASVLCAVHCLLTPVLLVLLPIIATTFWVSSDFHLWMLLCVIPTTSLAIFMGCRKHKDKAVVIMSFVGVLVLASVAGYESFLHAGETVALAEVHCELCAASVAEAGHHSLLSSTVLLNLFGGLLLASSHVRNFLLCRKANCSHGHEACES